MPSRVLATYRLQMRGDQFTFADAEKLVDYLEELGVSHVYLSPILTAAEGSTHGYDVIDPTEVSPALGGAEGLARLSEAARARGLGLIVDIVPNHVGVDDPTQNAWWWDVLARGRESAYARYFDVDWTLDPDGRIVLPVLGSDDDVERLTVDGDVLRLDGRTWPIASWYRHGQRSRGARPPALPPDRLAQQRVWLSTVLLDHVVGRAAPGGPRGLRRHSHRGEALVRRGPRRRLAHRPPRRTVRSGRLPRMAARTRPGPTPGS